jgi:hypothetical protein
VGFAKTCEFVEYWAVTDKAMQMAMKGNKCFQQSNNEEAVDWYGRSISNGFSSAWLFWNTACAYAYLEDQDQVFEHLDKAVEHGFTDRDFIQKSPHFTAFHGTNAWKDLMDKLAEVKDD